ncbi:citrate synthase family protein [Microvirga sp. ACRRW]|uniref:citrate synthase family protein n=1 Tax=Microvirga sp. ACRRW TaxID=2918205 RepID=UPI001EF6AA11|nr:citrate synthase family protein [Microvirga sp. ACRRW]MCG7392415.1 citrate synthase family protein [Microvirga sp. ACRRW]
MSLELTSAEEASGRLGISRASLYAYVSRGLIRSFSSPYDPRQRLYALDDVETLVEKKARFRRPAAAAATALDWGLPVLETSITQIKDGHLFYRGHDAIAWAQVKTLEETARLLIGGLDIEAFRLPSRRPHSLPGRALDLHDFVTHAVRLLSEPRPKELRAAEVATILRLMAAAGSGAAPEAEPLHEHLALAWKAPQASDAIRRTLVLCADHELSSSAFAVRVTASTGASLSNAIIAGLMALSGPYHGGMTERVRAFLEAPGKTAAPSFQHKLYPDGDPRAAAILENVPLLSSDATTLQAIAAGGGKPGIDTALVMLERAYGLPRSAAFTLFAVGRTAGWLAHAIEQRSQSQLIRPRARYVVGEEPSPS